MDSAPALKAGGASTASQSSDGFVIPTPRAQPAEQRAASAGGPSFREAGGRTGAAKPIPSVPGPAEAPAVPPVQQEMPRSTVAAGKGSGSASTTGGASAAQRSGTGVLVPGSSQPAAGPLDLGALDKALAGGAAAKPGARASGGAGKGGTSGSGGTGTGGTGTGTGGSGAAGAGTGDGNFGVQWGSPDAGKGRALVLSVSPKIPAWVSEQGLTLSVKVGFTVSADGVISAVRVERSSGYADVDASVVQAIGMSLFNSSPGAAPAKGTIPYLINPR
jgi:TonB family protein